MFVVQVEKEEVGKPLVLAVTERNLGWLEQLRMAIRDSSAQKLPLLLLCQGENTCGLLGLVNCLRWESAHLRCFFIRDEGAPDFSLDHPLYASQLKKDLLMNVYQEGQWGSYRHVRIDDNRAKTTLQVQHAYVNALTRGDLASLRWIEGPLSYHRPELHPDNQLCHVYYAPLNFRDVMLATGKLSPDALPGNMAGQDCILGAEFSGRDCSGRRVMGLVPARGMATTLLADKRMLWPVPDHWTLEEASTVPVVYCTSYYALVVRGHMRPGDFLLVHAGSGGVGLASIAIALHMGVTVFTTVGSQEKRQFLKNRFPQLTDRNIANSRDTSFEQHVLSETQGRGVDLVLNSLAEDKLQASVRCLARHGRFLEIGKFDLSNNSPLGMSMFLKNTSFHGILLDALFDSNTGDNLEVVRLLSEGVKSGAVQPLPATVFADSQAEQAFRYLASGKHIGKVVLQIRDEEPDHVTPPTPKLVAAIPRVYMNPEKVYVLVGGLGGFGLELANWLVLRGATRLVLTSRSGLITGYQSRCVRRWRRTGIEVAVSSVDCADAGGAAQLLGEAGKLGPVGGVFNLAAVLKDALLDNLGEEDFAAACRPKADTARNLDEASRRLCPELDYFVVFSSVVSGRGNVGQANYGMANSAMERVCERRQADGLPALAIQWGAVGDVGMVIDNIGDNDVVIAGTVPQRMSSCLASLDVLLHHPHPVVASMVLAERKSSDNGGGQVGLLDAVAKIIGIKNVKKLNPKVTLAEMGMDSLMGAEIKQTLERNYDIVLTPQDIRTMTFGHLMEKSVGGSAAQKIANPDSAHSGKTHVESLPELMPSRVLERLESKAMDDSKDRPLFVVHAIDGSVGHLRAVAAELSLPVWGVQCTAQTPSSTIQDMAAFYITHIQTVQPNGPYMIGGYSYGAMVAFEIGLQLEKKGEQVSIVLLDGSPAYITHHALAFKNVHEKGSAVKEAQIVANIMNLYIDIDYDQTKDELEGLASWEERLAKCVDVLSRVSPYSPQQLTEVAETLNVRMVVGDNYHPSEKYQGEVILCKAKDNFTIPEEDYGLSKICKRTPQVHLVEGNHKQILQGDSAKRIAGIITSLERA
ncbi:hypothetical protein PR048_010558 [Dryococelus australis]|uniref:oleoyl-[acyl-carrier-protein] hydrolase n=1 Tax=Dryococelus australis TaxID=614101 RepID=A0ABQ9I316_9NEOP|nr:hypothetical protein PR048_010558 [Dryococelus australis]